MYGNKYLRIKTIYDRQQCWKGGAIKCALQPVPGGSYATAEIKLASHLITESRINGLITV